MAGARVQVSGDRRLSSALRRGADDMGDLSAVSAQAAAMVAAGARGRTPRLTGALAATVRAGSSGPFGVASAGTAYANPIHWGWRARGIEGRPWLVDTAHQMEPVWIQLFQQEIDRVVGNCEGGP